MRCSRYCSLLMCLVFLAVAATAFAQQATSDDRTVGSPTLFELLQSRLQKSGLAPVEQPSATSAHAHQHRPQTVTLPTGRTTSLVAPPRYATRPASARTPASESKVLVASKAAPLPHQTTAQPSSSGTSRMHQRLSAFRSSTFADSATEPEPASSLRQPKPRLVETDDQPATAPRSMVARPTLAPQRPLAAMPAESKPPVEIPAEPRIAHIIPKYAARPAAEEPAPLQPAPVEAFTAAPIVTPKAVSNSSSNQPAATADLSAQVLFARQSPILNVKTVGPERIDVGREATFQVTIENLGSVPADELIVAIDFPQWADLLGAEVSTGATSSELAVDGTRLFRWKIGHMAAKDAQTVILHLIARQSQPFDLAVNLQHAPVANGARINVLQPDLKLNLEGPEEVLFGKRQIYRLELENTGTGDARGVTLALLPLGTGQEEPVVQPIGNLAAGATKVIEVELTARNEGDLMLQVDATAEGNIHAHLSEKVRVLRPGLTVDVTAPEFQFVGKELTYQIVVANPGTATAGKVKIEAVLPPSMKYVSSTEDGLTITEDDRLQWSVAQLEPQETRTLLINCVATAPGDSRLTVATSAADNLRATTETAVEIDAIADLALEVEDPSGPVPVDTETVYEIKVENRGSKAADNVEVVAYFSHGIEPLGAQGAKHRLGPGQVVFDAVKSIAPGGSKTFSISARAQSTGNHIIRAEVFCKPLGTRLVGEESTYFYASRSTKPTSPARPTASGEGVLTADQRGAAPPEE